MKRKKRPALQDRTTLIRAEACTIVLYRLLATLGRSERKKLYRLCHEDGRELGGDTYAEEVAWIFRDTRAASDFILSRDGCS